ncbi:MAG: Holliday junction resolvase RuvX [Candidatus Bipolaricaulota bacterium]
MRTLGIDYGRRRHGLALSDEDGLIARPLEPLRRSRSEDEDLARLISLASAHGVVRIVVGLPLLPDGTHGTMAQEAREFAERVGAATGLAVEVFDERGSSAEAERALLEGNVSRRRRKSLRDGLSAVLILQGYLALLRERSVEDQTEI